MWYVGDFKVGVDIVHQLYLKTVMLPQGATTCTGRTSDSQSAFYFSHKWYMSLLRSSL